MASWDEIPGLVKIGIVVGIALLLSVGFYFLELKPIADQNQADQEALKSKQAEIAQLAPYRTKLNDLNKQIALLAIQLEAQSKIVPVEKEVPSFITLMQAQAAQSGVQIRRYTAKPSAQQQYYVEVPFEMDVDGPYYAVVNFFERVAQMERIVDVSGLTMGSIKEGKSGSKHNYSYGPHETVSTNCVAKTFYSSPKSAAPAPAKGNVKKK